MACEEKEYLEQHESPWFYSLVNGSDVSLLICFIVCSDIVRNAGYFKSVGLPMEAYMLSMTVVKFGVYEWS